MNSVRTSLNQLNKRLVTFALSFCLLLVSLSVEPVCAAAAKELNPSVDTVLANVGSYILSVDTNPDYSSTWNVIGLVRSGREIPQTYLDDYYNNTVNYLEERNWQLSRTKYSDYSKLILGMTAIGKDARDIDGHNILSYLSDFSKVKLQGFNGPIWALIALNCHPDYEIPIDLAASEQTTEEGLIQYLLKGETSAGGWTLFGDTPDTDITGMTIQALAPYYGKREDVTSAVDRALTWMSSAQNNEGGYSTLNGNSTSETSESDAQVIVALCSIGIDPAKDSRFIRPNGEWVISRLFEYYIPAGSGKAGFMHIFSGADDNGGGAAGTLNGMATEQGMYATAAYKRLLTGKTGLYDMSDINLSSGQAAVPPSTPSPSQKTTTGSGSSATTSRKKTVKVSKLLLNYKQITLQKGKTRTLKLKVYPTNAKNKKVRWTSSNKKVATVSSKGKVRGIKPGKAKITVTARDGSKKKAVCKVIVKKVTRTGSSGNVRNSSNRSSSGSSRNSGNSGSSGNTGSANSGSASSWKGSGSSSAGSSTISAQSGQGSSSGGQSPASAGSSSVPGSAGADASASGGSGTKSGTGSGGGNQVPAGVWSFNGDAYVPESSSGSDDSGQSAGSIAAWDPEAEGLSNYDGSEDQDLGEMGEFEEDSLDGRQKTHGRMPLWLLIVLGVLAGGACAGLAVWILIRQKRSREKEKAETTSIDLESDIEEVQSEF